jgi:hypothetical protein
MIGQEFNMEIVIIEDLKRFWAWLSHKFLLIQHKVMIFYRHGVFNEEDMVWFDELDVVNMSVDEILELEKDIKKGNVIVDKSRFFVPVCDDDK